MMFWKGSQGGRSWGGSGIPLDFELERGDMDEICGVLRKKGKEVMSRRSGELVLQHDTRSYELTIWTVVLYNTHEITLWHHELMETER